MFIRGNQKNLYMISCLSLITLLRPWLLITFLFYVQGPTKVKILLPQFYIHILATFKKPARGRWQTGFGVGLDERVNLFWTTAIFWLSNELEFFNKNPFNPDIIKPPADHGRSDPPPCSTCRPRPVPDLASPPAWVTSCWCSETAWRCATPRVCWPSTTPGVESGWQKLESVTQSSWPSRTRGPFLGLKTETDSHTNGDYFSTEQKLPPKVIEHTRWHKRIWKENSRWRSNSNDKKISHLFYLTSPGPFI